MGIIVGSARIDEHGNISGGAAGDQTGREVSTQSFYMHSLGWYCLRPKNATHAARIATAMKNACDNNNIGYDQSNRAALKMVRKYGSTKAIAEKTETDCSNLVRACIYEATGVDVGNFSTGSEASVLVASGLFEAKRSVSSSADVYNGDVLVTKSKGHTVVVVSGRPRETASTGSNNGKLNRNRQWVGVVNTGCLNVRTWAGAENPKLKSVPTINKGTKLYVCDTIKASNGDDWYYVELMTGQHGFVRSKYISRA